MTTEIDTEVDSILLEVAVRQGQLYEDTSSYFSILKRATNVAGLSYSVLKYKNSLQGQGYGVVFTYVDEAGTRFQKSVDAGFRDPDIIITGFHPVSDHDWVEIED